MARLLEALEVIRDRADNVRLIRVLSGEDPPPAAKKQGDFHYVVDLMPRGGGAGKGAIAAVMIAAVVGAAKARSRRRRTWRCRRTRSRGLWWGAAS